ncbi:restriction endonuclease subunit S [Lactobacillus helsingborgensis]|uniref:restriction endonuclease subunit S n=1 Tax=Lactobacillus helsingborgensis TaxID=1218494 RepID=UPI00351B9DA1
MDYRGKTPKKLGMNWTENQKDIIALSAKNIKDNKIVNTDKSHYGSELLYKHWMKDGDIEPGDILMTSEAPLGEVYLVSKPIKAILSQRLFLLRFNKKIVNPWYMYAFMNSQSFKNQLLLRATGTTVVGIKQKDLRKIEVELPSRELQNKIGSIFQFLYKKIHINGRINDNLMLQKYFSNKFSLILNNKIFSFSLIQIRSKNDKFSASNLFISLTSGILIFNFLKYGTVICC